MFDHLYDQPCHYVTDETLEPPDGASQWKVLDSLHFTSGNYVATDSAPQLLQQVLQHMGSREPALRRERQTVASKTELEAAIAAHPWAADYLRGSGML